MCVCARIGGVCGVCEMWVGSLELDLPVYLVFLGMCSVGRQSE